MICHSVARWCPARCTAARVAAFCLALVWQAPLALAQDNTTFASLAGRWTGEGRLGLKDSPPENVKCRATYFVSDGKNELKQTIRCATAGGSIEVQSQIQDVGGALTGTWTETTRNLAGDLVGTVRPGGFRIVVKGSALNASMDILVKDNKQIIEIQFTDSALVGLSLLMIKG